MVKWKSTKGKTTIYKTYIYNILETIQMFLNAECCVPFLCNGNVDEKINLRLKIWIVNNFPF
jgi:hypothetical protein